MLQFLRMPINLLQKANKAVQEAGANCLQKVIQNSSEELITQLLEEITDKICSVIKLKTFKAQNGLLETVISLIFHVEQEIQPYSEKLLEVILDQIKSDESVVKKVSIDAVYALTAIIKE